VPDVPALLQVFDTDQLPVGEWVEEDPTVDENWVSARDPAVPGLFIEQMLLAFVQPPRGRINAAALGAMAERAAGRLLSGCRPVWPGARRRCRSSGRGPSARERRAGSFRSPAGIGDASVPFVVSSIGLKTTTA
jgi:hypothetical protein